MSTTTQSVTVVVPGTHLMATILGERDQNLRAIEEEFPQTSVLVRGNEVTLEGPDAVIVGKVFEELTTLVQAGQPLDVATLSRAVGMVRADQRPSVVLTQDIVRMNGGRTVRAKTSGQRRYVDAIRDNVVTFGIGPAGTGKSWLAVAMAVQIGPAHHPHEASGGGRRAIGIPPRRPCSQDRSVSSAAV
jgi:phosphate starvation-inducible PhoH-like protein